MWCFKLLQKLRDGVFPAEITVLLAFFILNPSCRKCCHLQASKHSWSSTPPCQQGGGGLSLLLTGEHLPEEAFRPEAWMMWRWTLGGLLCVILHPVQNKLFLTEGWALKVTTTCLNWNIKPYLRHEYWLKISNNVGGKLFTILKMLGRFVKFLKRNKT